MSILNYGGFNWFVCGFCAFGTIVQVDMGNPGYACILLLLTASTASRVVVVGGREGFCRQRYGRRLRQSTEHRALRYL